MARNLSAIGASDLDASRLGLGANTFGWTADRDAAFAVLDAYVEAGGNFVDTADSYGRQSFVGASETIIGEWFAARGRRDDVILATKVGSLASRPGLSAATITAAVDDSLRRMQTDHIDLYWAHKDDPDTPQEETLAAFDGLVRAGKVRAIGASNFKPDRLASALAIAEREGLAAYVALQPHYNLMERAEFEALLLPVLTEHGLSCVPYYGLAKGFLTGKYRPGSVVDSPRAAGATSYLDERGLTVLAALDEVAAAHGVPVAAVALAWLAAQPTVVAPLASARSVDQLDRAAAHAGAGAVDRRDRRAVHGLAALTRAVHQHHADEREREPGDRQRLQRLAQHRHGQHRGDRRHEVEQPAGAGAGAATEQHEQQDRPGDRVHHDDPRQRGDARTRGRQGQAVLGQQRHREHRGRARQ